MTDGGREIIDLYEYKPVTVRHGLISDAVGELIWRSYGSQVAVDEPGIKIGPDWILTSLGWVGFIPVTNELGLRLNPKLPLGNLFRMLEYAYRLKSFEFLKGVTESGSLVEFYERLANVLAKKVLDRARKGFYRTYIPVAEELPYVRGSVDLSERLRRPWIVRLPCSYQDHTADIDDNQILAWTLLRVARSTTCTERVLPTVRSAYRALQGFARVEPFRPEACIRRLYNRLNDDYEPMHALCRFFLEHTGPTIDHGDAKTLPFLVNMGRLFELFVAEWLKAHLPSQFEVRYQERVQIGGSHELHFDIDMVLRDRATGTPLAVLDTKYKADERPDPGDLLQIVAYAEAMGCRDAILIYPAELSPPLSARVGEITVRGLTFWLDGDLEEGGCDLLRQLMSGGAPVGCSELHTGS